MRNGLSLDSMPDLKKKKMRGMSPTGGELGDISAILPMLQQMMGGMGGGMGGQYAEPPQLRGVGGTSPIRQPFTGGILGRGL